jgi:hypothetical protein
MLGEVGRMDNINKINKQTRSSYLYLSHKIMTLYLAKSVQCNATYEFKVCKSVHHRTVQINHQPDATIFQFIILTLIYSSTCFGRFPAHHQELNDCSSSLWFYLRIVVIAVLRFWLDHEHSTTVTTIRR